MKTDRQYSLESCIKVFQKIFFKRIFSTVVVSSLGCSLVGSLASSSANAAPVVLRGQLPGHFVKVRLEPDVESTVVALQSVGVVAERMDQLRQSNGRVWGHLRFDDGSLGWVPLDYWRPVTRLAPPAEETPVAAHWTGRLLPAEIGESIRVYAQPEALGLPRYEAGTGSRVQIFASEIGPEGYLWYHVSLPSYLQGWVRADQVQQVRDVLR